MNYLGTCIMHIHHMTSGSTATEASKARALPKFWVIVNTISARGAYYAHHSTIGLVYCIAQIHRDAPDIY